MKVIQVFFLDTTEEHNLWDQTIVKKTMVSFLKDLHL